MYAPKQTFLSNQSFNPTDIALFVDFDGTLVDFADTPEAVIVSNQINLLLESLHLHLNGAFALISGRTLDSLMALVDADINMAGSHGAQWRYRNGARQSVSLPGSEFINIKALLAEYGKAKGLLIEDKGNALALHYRTAPEQQQSLDSFIDNTLKLPQRKDIRIIRGNCVREILLAGTDKGVAIARFMSQPPFYGRKPLFIGDDTTDEDGFAWVNAHKGISIKVGEGVSCAVERFSNTGEVLAFLTMTIKQLENSEERLDDTTQPGTGTHR
ncbi:trehalose-phosphatase [Shewanella sp. AS1]|uniref:trehalose-phosphatase n=1 Tax=Shewanella sp. AS1 TaxID=2907626 RepID=UPI001F459119|nr:trehalose-phosphatase [Shewanella sp. AS1]MCE9679005.1 trehalose-phosphatase [Shewanella sp. AS1]